MKKTLILIEDNDNDAFLVQKAVESHPTKEVEVYRLSSGQEALEFFSHDSLNPHPDLIVIDLHMPRINGLDILSVLKSGKWKNIPSIILSGSSNSDHVSQTFLLQGNSFVQKSLSLSEFDKMCRTLVDYWFVHGKTP